MKWIVLHTAVARSIITYFLCSLFFFLVHRLANVVFGRFHFERIFRVIFTIHFDSVTICYILCKNYHRLFYKAFVLRTSMLKTITWREKKNQTNSSHFNVRMLRLAQIISNIFMVSQLIDYLKRTPCEQGKYRLIRMSFLWAPINRI